MSWLAVAFTASFSRTPLKTLLRLLPLFISFASLCRASDDALLAAIRAADDERCAAVIAGDRARLEAIFSDDLRYAHSNGNVDTKESFIASLTSNTTDYQSIESDERNIASIAPDVALVSGRSRIKIFSAAQQLDLHLSYLAVYHKENGRWRFLAWQSCRLPAPTAATK